MAFWARNRRRTGTTGGGGGVSMDVLDPRRQVPVDRPGLLLGERRLPRITGSSFTDLLAAHTRARHAPGTGPVAVVVRHGLFAEDGGVVFMGLAGRAAIVVRLTPQLRADLHGLGEAIVADGAELYLDAHEGFLRASLLLPALSVDLDVGMLLREGNVQEFLRAAYDTETVELHIEHTTHDRVLPYVCEAPGVRAVLDEGFDYYTQSPPADLRASLLAVDDSLNPAMRVPLRFAGKAEPGISYDVEV
ncbi:hypothetical protein [Streptomyces sp. MAR4 CNX-425]|uniref:hypothetical protein n=1 Tax=Streptomyces sp. MAR4 CNX-425 TaxID=3406343 RepID=UPI003B508DCE